MSLTQSFYLAGRALHNYITNKPIVISFEVTHSCTCDCLHCNIGGKIEEKNLFKTQDYTTLVLSLNPCAVQISGGEPLLRGDVIDIVKAIKKHPDDLPHIIFVSNGSLLNEENYAELRKSGVDRFSISLDFPDERHDEFRRHPGLYNHLKKIIPDIVTKFGNNRIAMNSAITRANLPYLVDLANKACEWGVCISYSAYGALRTGDKSLFISVEEDLEMLQQKIYEIIQIKKKKKIVLNSIYTLKKTYEFFKNGYIPNCSAGRRFLVINPQGKLVPCSMRPHHKVYSTQDEMLSNFSKHNKCGECYVAIRAYSDKSLLTLLKDNISFFFSNIL